MRLLFVKMSSLGDIVQTWPALAWIKRRVPSASIDWVAESEYLGLLQMHPMVDHVVSVPFRKWRRAGWRKSFCSGELTKDWKNLTKQLQAHPYDAVIDFQGLLKSAFVCRLASGGDTRSHGWEASACREPLASRFYDQTYVGQHFRAQHAVLRYIELIDQVCVQLGAVQGEDAKTLDIDYGLKRPPLVKCLPERAAHKLDAEEALDGRPSERTVWLLHGSARPEKCWPEAAWIELGMRLSSEGFRCAIAWGSPAEQNAASRMVEAIPNAWMPSDRPSYPVWQHWFARAALAVGVDSGLLFLAAASSLPTLGLYIATSPDHVGVLGVAPFKNLEGNLGVELVAEEALKLLRCRVP